MEVFIMMTLYGIYQRPAWALSGLLVAVVWSLIWKGYALWYSSQNKQKGWFIALLIVNTLGLLEILYLIWFRPQPLGMTVSVEKKPQVQHKTVTKTAAKPKKKTTV